VLATDLFTLVPVAMIAMVMAKMIIMMMAKMIIMVMVKSIIKMMIMVECECRPGICPVTAAFVGDFSLAAFMYGATISTATGLCATYVRAVLGQC
jgi:hypothetical protein